MKWVHIAVKFSFGKLINCNVLVCWTLKHFFFCVSQVTKRVEDIAIWLILSLQCRVIFCYQVHSQHFTGLSLNLRWMQMEQD